METTKSSGDKHLFRLKPMNSVDILGGILQRGRFLVGRTESCDVVIPASIVSAVHAVIEVTGEGIKIYDMNSKNGTYINGEKIVAREVKLGDRIFFGNVEFELQRYNEVSELPPVLNSLAPNTGEARLHQESISAHQLPDMAPPSSPTDNVTKTQVDVPYIVYPLSRDPGSDASEYIFEDEKELFPIFKYELNKQSVEVIILFNDKVYSVDYLPEKNAVYNIAGVRAKSEEVEFPYLGKNDRIPFVEVQSGNCVVNGLDQYELLHLTNNDLKEVSSGRVNLQDNDIVKLVKGHLEIYIRRVASPPKVKPAPIFNRDGELKKYVLLVFLLVLLPVVALNFYTVDEELKKEKEPERIATILYKQKLDVSLNKAVEKTEKKEVKKQTAPKKKVVKKEEPKKKEAPKQAVTKTETKTQTKDPGVKSAAKKQVVKRVKDPAPKRDTIAPVKTASAAVSNVKTAQTRRANAPSKNVGRVDAYKSFDFKSTINTLVAKGGSLKGATTQRSQSNNNIRSASIGGGVATDLKSANVGSEVGSLTGATVGKLGQSKGTEGLSAKTGVYTAGIPSETVVLGSMDPDVIRRILREHIPQFRYCYQKELDRNASSKVAGMIRLSFSIGASGHVSRAGVDGNSRLPAHVRGCVVSVLRGIQFPRPMGGGVVDVKQPFNFYPKNG